MSEPKEVVWFHRDLDGTASYLALAWILKRKPVYVSTTPSTLKADWEKWKQTNSLDEQTRVYFLDLDTMPIAEEIDQPNVVVFDHHETNAVAYKRAKAVIKPYSSCIKLLYDTLGKNTEFSHNQKVMVLLADDYDAWTKKTPLSHDLNIVFHKTNRKVESFIENFSKGFAGFDKFQNKLIEFYKVARDEYLKKHGQVYAGEFAMGGKSYKTIAIFADEYVQELNEYLIKKYEADVGIVVIQKSGLVSIRRKEGSEFDCGKFAEKICDGGGHPYSAGGRITNMFMGLTKLLRPVE